MIIINFLLCSMVLSYVSSNTMEGSYFQGDMKGIETIETEFGLTIKNTNGIGNWDYGVIPYAIYDDFTYEDVQMILSAMRKIEEQTNKCIQFIRRINEKPFIELIDDEYTSSYVGKQSFYIDNNMPITLDRYHMNFGTVLHELLHVIGLHHEHTRPERDNYLNYYSENVASENDINFKKYIGYPVTSQSLPYDIKSLMHWNERMFSKNGEKTLEARQNIQLGDVTMKMELSRIDVEKIRRMYGCHY